MFEQFKSNIMFTNIYILKEEFEKTPNYQLSLTYEQAYLEAMALGSGM